jgi:hypothetical protein
MMLDKHVKMKLYTLCIILPIGSMILAVGGITTSKSFAPKANTVTDGETLEGSQVAASFLGDEIQISLPTTPESDHYKPAIAYNSVHDEFLVVWHNTWPSGHNDIYARRVSATGQLLSWFSVSAGTNNRSDPAVAYNATNDEYLVVWRYNANGDGTTYDIWGRTIAWNGAYLNPEFQIITWPNRTFRKPEVVWNQIENEYLVVWSAFDATTSLATDVADALLDSHGNKAYGAIISSSDHPHQADVTYNCSTNEYFVVWRYMDGSQGNIRGARVSAGFGIVVNPPGEIAISSDSDDEQFPAVTSNGYDLYLVAWQKQNSGNWGVRVKDLDVTGIVGSTIFALGIIIPSNHFKYPDIVTQPGYGHDFLLTWQWTTTSEEEITAYYSGDASDNLIKVAANTGWDYESPVAAWGKVGSMLVYEGESQIFGMYRHIYGSQWAPYAVFLPTVIR